jgi:hypothetical protein
MKKVKVRPTQRGFLKGEFTDLYGAKCSIQKSSLATDDAIWLGIDDADPQIMCSDAIRMGLRTITNTEADNGWCKYPLPKEVFLTTRMHLSKKEVKKLLPLLQKFVETGELK